MKKVTDLPLVKSVEISSEHTVYGNFGGKSGQVTINDLRAALNEGDNEVLSMFAFYIDVNKKSSLGTIRVDVGGNMNMREIWENSKTPVLMDANGNYCELNRDDCRYTAEGEYLLNEDGTVITKYAHCDFMEIIPQYYGKVQLVTVGETVFPRLWISPVQLPGGYTIPRQVVAKFKSGVVNGAMRSIPGIVPAGTKTINAFWDMAQVRSKNHGLANLDFRNYLLFHMMSKYGYRDVQNAEGSDGTKIWGVGLDGTEGLADGETYGNNGFTNQKTVVMGQTLSLGDNDGNCPVTLDNGNIAHSVNVCGFENPYGQYWEMVQGLCSVGTDVYHWRGNVMPTGTPTEATFNGMDCVKLTRHTTAGYSMNIINDGDGQGVYMIPKESMAGISYGDYFSYSETGQLWLFGGSSNIGAHCGLASATSHHAWSNSSASISARLAYYGDVNKVSPTRLAELAA